ncbi:uncharacterized protein LOC127432147 isoform X2 [Myxocyprinus asiaticus]|uniref:uncharacterized protein LOC127432147 isoform X2 n=1 Tax=Myxocyprinus asiaticus TaxID=70543 RepID=UPI002223B408|nr:uncharacterized protein LOC127432147 isoform X2 [Myxocyprinus asiaticus]
MEMRVSLVILSVLLAFIREDEGQKTRVSHFPNFPEVYVGDDLSLKCNGKELEPYAQLSLSTGGAVIAKGDGRHLILQVDDDLQGWTCFASRFGGSGSKLGINPDKGTKRAFVFAELKEAYRASFWCLNRKTRHRSNAVTLKMTEKRVMLEPSAEPVMQGEGVALRCVVWGGAKVEQAMFYRNQAKIQLIKDDTYTITNATQHINGQYSCHATYRYSHISPQAALQEGDSDPQELKVIDGPFTTSVVLTSHNNLQCLCHQCYSSCTSYRWYHTPSDNSNIHTKLSEIGQNLNAMEDGLYRCRADCIKGFSRYSKAYNHQVKPASEGGGKTIIVLTVFLIIIGLLIMLVVLKCRKRGGSGIRAVGEGKDKQPGGDYEQINLKEQAVYHTLGDAMDQDKGEGGYEPLKKSQEEAVYHTVAQGQDQGGYEALKNVKAEVYNTLGPSEGQSQGQGEGKQKPANYEDVKVEENPYEDLKGEKQEKTKTTKEAE